MFDIKTPQPIFVDRLTCTCASDKLGMGAIELKGKINHHEKS